MKRKKLGIYIVAASLAASLFTGCSMSIMGQGNNESPQAQGLPEWYVNATQSNSFTLYGVGEGGSLEEAKSQALNAMASSLSVSVSSVMNKEEFVQSDNRGQSDSFKSVKNRVNLEVQRIEFTNSRVVKNTVVDGTFYVLVSVDRDELFKLKSERFFSLDKKIDNAYKMALSSSALESLKALKTLEKEITEAKGKAVVLSAIKPEFKISKYLDKYNNYLLKQKELLAQFVIYVDSDSGYFAQEMIEALNGEQLKVTKYASRSNVTVKVRNRVRKSMYKSFYIVKVSTTITTKSGNKIVSNKTLNSVGRSGSSHANALADASKRFAKKVKQEGVNNLLGFN